MGNFEKLSVLVIVVIIVMILVVAIYEWTGSPSDGASSGTEAAKVVTPSGEVQEPWVTPAPGPAPAPGVTPTPAVGGDKKSAGAANGASANGAGTPAKDDKSWFDRPLIPTEGDKALSAAGSSGDPIVAGDKPAPVAPAEPKPEGTEIPETTHVVASGDTLGGISKKYYGKASLYSRIEEANPGVTATSLRVGQKLKIPALKLEAGKAAPVLASTSKGDKSDDGASESSGERPVPGKEYKVKGSDTWERISKAAFKTSERWPEIYMKNLKLTPSPRDLRPGLVIMIPR